MTEELSFYNEVAWEGGAVGEVAFPSDHQIKVALPAEFGGVEGFPSPEDLFVAAANARVFTHHPRRRREEERPTPVLHLRGGRGPGEAGGRAGGDQDRYKGQGRGG